MPGRKNLLHSQQLLHCEVPELSLLSLHVVLGERATVQNARCNFFFCQWLQSSQHFVLTFTAFSCDILQCVNVVLDFHRHLRFFRLKPRVSCRAARAALYNINKLLAALCDVWDFTMRKVEEKIMPDPNVRNSYEVIVTRSC